MCNRRFGVHEFVSFAMGAMGVACSGQTLALTSSNANIGNGTDGVGSSGLGGGIASGAGAGSTSASGVTVASTVAPKAPPPMRAGARAEQ
jgi:hypothetical protein